MRNLFGYLIVVLAVFVVSGLCLDTHPVFNISIVGSSALTPKRSEATVVETYLWTNATDVLGGLWSIFRFEWTAEKQNSTGQWIPYPMPSTSTTSSLYIPPYELDFGDYRFNVKCYYVENPSNKDEKMVTVTVSNQGLDAKIDGPGSRTESKLYGFDLDGSGSSDLDKLCNNLTYAWTCKNSSGQPCVDASMTQLVFAETPIIYVPPMNVSGTYTFTLEIAGRWLSDSAAVTVTVVDKDYIPVRLSYSSASVDAAKDFSIVAKFWSDSAETISFSWGEQKEGLALTTSNTIRMSDVLTVKGGTMEEELTYKFVVNVTSSNADGDMIRNGTAEVSITTVKALSYGALDTNNETTWSLENHVLLTQSNWTTPVGSLSYGYYFYAKDVNGDLQRVPIAKQKESFLSGLDQGLFEYLPQGMDVMDSGKEYQVGLAGSATDSGTGITSYSLLKAFSRPTNLTWGDVKHRIKEHISLREGDQASTLLASSSVVPLDTLTELEERLQMISDVFDFVWAQPPENDFYRLCFAFITSMRQAADSLDPNRFFHLRAAPSSEQLIQERAFAIVQKMKAAVSGLSGCPAVATELVASADQLLYAPKYLTWELIPVVQEVLDGVLAKCSAGKLSEEVTNFVYPQLQAFTLRTDSEKLRLNAVGLPNGVELILEELMSKLKEDAGPKGTWPYPVDVTMSEFVDSPISELKNSPDTRVVIGPAVVVKLEGTTIKSDYERNDTIMVRVPHTSRWINLMPDDRDCASPSDDFERPICVSWDSSIGRWSTERCYWVQGWGSDAFTYCRCKMYGNETTDFISVMAVEEDECDESIILAISVIGGVVIGVVVAAGFFVCIWFIRMQLVKIKDKALSKRAESTQAKAEKVEQSKELVEKDVEKGESSVGDDDKVKQISEDGFSDSSSETMSSTRSSGSKGHSEPREVKDVSDNESSIGSSSVSSDGI